MNFRLILVILIASDAGLYARASENDRYNKMTLGNGEHVVASFPVAESIATATLYLINNGRLDAYVYTDNNVRELGMENEDVEAVWGAPPDSDLPNVVHLNWVTEVGPSSIDFLFYHRSLEYGGYFPVARSKEIFAVSIQEGDALMYEGKISLISLKPLLSSDGARLFLRDISALKRNDVTPNSVQPLELVNYEDMNLVTWDGKNVTIRDALGIHRSRLCSVFLGRKLVSANFRNISN